MKWFKHDGNALSDPKIEKLIMKYGIEGYGLYFACVEIIAGNLATDKITFELEHDAEILAYKFKIDTLKVEDMMKYMAELGLFHITSGKIACYKLAKRLDNTMSQNTEMRKLLSSGQFKETLSNFKKLEEPKSTIQENTIQENTKEDLREDKKKYGEYVELTKEQYEDLCKEYKKLLVDDVICEMNEYCKRKKPYTLYYKALKNWLNKEVLSYQTSLSKITTTAGERPKNWRGEYLD